MKPDTRSFYERAVVAAVRRVATSLDEALDLHALARGASLSPLHFHRVFRGLAGETPLELHRRLRLERAAHRLRETDESVVSLALEAGYETHESFTRAFGAAYGLSPSAFRSSASCLRTALVSPSGVHFDPSLDVMSRVEPLFQGDPTPMHVTTESLPSLRVFSLRHVGSYARIGETFARLGAIAQATGLFADPRATMIALYHDAPEGKPEAELQSDAGIVVSEGQARPDGLDEILLPAGRFAKATHMGSYAGLPAAWARLMGDWLPKSGLRVGDGLPFELYRSDPRFAKEADLVTELYVPVTAP